MAGQILTLNAGSSSLKFALFEPLRDDATRCRVRGQLEGIGAAARLVVQTGDGGQPARRQWRADEAAPRDVRAALQVVLAELDSRGLLDGLRAIGHRIVHGGTEFSSARAVDDALLARIEGLQSLAPLHQPYGIACLRAARERFVHAAQVACFDTAFHRTQAFVEDTFALPREYYDAGVRRYGFHGLSYQYVAQRYAQLDPLRGRGRVVIAHLGNGASACALRDGRSTSSTMGFTALDGLPMGTRCGQIDPGVLLWLMQERKMDADAISDLLYRHSGLKGLSGLSNDMRVLRASESSRAREAIEYFVARLAREIAALAASIGGIDALVFTAGIGENDAAVRAGACASLHWLGVRVDDAANAAAVGGREARISTADSPIAVWVVPTDEESTIAGQTLDVIEPGAAAA
ncbi:MAG: acetate/propionate family kinase [Burkholderiaceae bacterium]|nr:acetate/propionate family kinase [Burkholderiaceae bacterium]